MKEDTNGTMDVFMKEVSQKTWKVDMGKWVMVMEGECKECGKMVKWLKW